TVLAQLDHDAGVGAFALAGLDVEGEPISVALRRPSRAHDAKLGVAAPVGERSLLRVRRFVEQRPAAVADRDAERILLHGDGDLVAAQLDGAAVARRRV